MPSTHRTYGKDFRQEAVNLLLSSGRPLERGGRRTRCYRQFFTDLAGQGFRQGARSAGRFGGAERPQRSALADPAGEIRRLQRENEYLRRQREILKKAMSILSEEPQSGMR